MKLADLNRHFPIANTIVEITASTKKKQGSIKIQVPDELINILMDAAVGHDVPIDGLVIAYRDKRDKTEQ